MQPAPAPRRRRRCSPERRGPGPQSSLERRAGAEARTRRAVGMVAEASRQAVTGQPPAGGSSRRAAAGAPACSRHGGPARPARADVRRRSAASLRGCLERGPALGADRGDERRVLITGGVGGPREQGAHGMGLQRLRPVLVLSCDGGDHKDTWTSERWRPQGRGRAPSLRRWTGPGRTSRSPSRPRSARSGGRAPQHTAWGTRPRTTGV